MDKVNATETRLGVVLRVVFFIAVVIVARDVFPWALMGWFGTLVAATCGIFAAGAGANWLTMRIFDRRPFEQVGLALLPGWSRNLGLGIGLGGGAAAVMLVLPLLAQAGRLVPRTAVGHTSWGSLVFYLAVLIIGATGEELMFRGYAFQLLVQKIGPFATVLPVGVIFGIAHNWNPHATLLGDINTILWGILLGYAFLRSHDLWLPIGLHYGWNAVLPLFGVNLSGITIEITRYEYRWDLAPIWSGGAYGPEGGLLTTVFVILVFFLVHKAPVAVQPAAIATVLNDPDFSV